MESWLFKQRKILLEIKMPKEVLKPIRSMEQVFSAIWGNLFDPADWFEYWFEGKSLQTGHLEMVSLEGEPHLYIRVAEERRNAIESSIYSQYPEAEISVVDDYTKYVPPNIPNKDWEMWGCDYMLVKPDVYPIKTYTKFFEERPEVVKEEKRVDPMATLLEGMGRLGPGEQLWIQIEIKPVLSTKNPKEGGYDFVSAGREIADKLAKRPGKVKPKSVFLEAAEVVAAGKVPGEEKKEGPEVFPPELRLTPGEREIIEGVEGKIAKRCFQCWIRFIYLAKRDLYMGAAKTIPFGFFNQFSTENLNILKPWPKTLTKVKKHSWLGLFRKRRLYVKKRRLFWRYLGRLDPLFPRPSQEASFILNTEELATIFHFPGRIAAPAPFVPRVEAKRGEAPPGLPME